MMCEGLRHEGLIREHELLMLFDEVGVLLGRSLL